MHKVGFLVLLLAAVVSVNAATVTVNPNQQFQTMTGWEAHPQSGHEDPSYNLFSDELLDQAVNDFGLTRLRLEIKSGAENNRDYFAEQLSGAISYATWRCVRYSTVNDNNDPFVIDWNGFHFTDMDRIVERVVLPFKQRVEANGEKFYLNLNYVAFIKHMTGTGCSSGLSYHQGDDPEEYAELIEAATLHLQSKYGLVPDTWEIILEPEHNNYFDGTYIGQAVVATAARLEAHGFSPQFTIPSTTSEPNALTYFNAAVAVPGALPYIQELSYHRYSGYNPATTKAIGDRAAALGINAAMLEHIDSDYRDLYTDLTNGRNSAWQQFALAFPGTSDSGSAYYRIDTTDPANPQIIMNTRARYLRQYFKHIRPGAVRIGATSSGSSVEPVAFINPDGRYVVVLRLLPGGDATSITGLPAGTYGIDRTAGNAQFSSLPDVTITAGQTLVTSTNTAGSVAIYQKTGGTTPPPPQDTTPPIRSNGQPSGQLAAGTTSATLQLTTNEAATCKYSTTAGQTYTSMPNTFTTTGGTSHTRTISGLTNGQSYNYYIRCQDTAGNANTNDITASFSVASPAIQLNEPAGMTTLFSTDGADKYFTSSVGAFGYGAGWDDDTRTAVVADATNPTGSGFAIEKRYFIGDADGWQGLASINSYNSGPYDEHYFRARVYFSPNWQDHTSHVQKLWYFGANGQSTTFYMDAHGLPDGTFKLQMVPQISSAAGLQGADGSQGDAKGSATFAKGQWATIEVWLKAQSAPGAADGELTIWLDGQLNGHWTGLQWYSANAADVRWNGVQAFLYYGGSGNTKTVNDYVRIGEFYASGRQTTPQDTTPPTRGNGAPSGTLAAGTTSTTLQITTNEAATCKYSTTAGQSYSSMPNTFATTGGTSHSTSISSLSNGQSYNYYIRCQDAAGNPNANDTAISFSVSQPPAKPGDLNGDDAVDLQDLLIVLVRINKDPTLDPRSDVNNDNTVNIFDLVLVARNFEVTDTSPPPPTGSLSCANPGTGWQFCDDFSSDLSQWTQACGLCSTTQLAGEDVLHIPYCIDVGGSTPQCATGSADNNRFVQVEMKNHNLHHFFIQGDVYMPSSPTTSEQKKLYYMFSDPWGANWERWDVILKAEDDRNGRWALKIASNNYPAYSDIVVPINCGYVDLDRWYELEMEVKLNTVGQSDGHINLWVDGQLACSRTGISIRNQAYPLGNARVGAQANDNDGPYPAIEDRYWDNVVISSQRIG